MLIDEGEPPGWAPVSLEELGQVSTVVGIGKVNRVVQRWTDWPDKQALVEVQLSSVARGATSSTVLSVLVNWIVPQVGVDAIFFLNELDPQAAGVPEGIAAPLYRFAGSSAAFMPISVGRASSNFGIALSGADTARRSSFPIEELVQVIHDAPTPPPITAVPPPPPPPPADAAYLQELDQRCAALIPDARLLRDLLTEAATRQGWATDAERDEAVRLQVATRLELPPVTGGESAPLQAAMARASTHLGEAYGIFAGLVTAIGPELSEAIGTFSQAVIRFQVDLVGFDALHCKDFA
jgi:hypothetical protein